MMNENLLNWAVGIIISLPVILWIVFFYKIYNRLNQMVKRRLISPNQKESLRILTTSNFIQILSLFGTGILILWTIYFSVNSLLVQTDLSKQNIELVEQTSSSNWANIEIDYRYPENHIPFEVSAKRLAEPNQGEDLPLLIINSGKVNTGKFKIDYMEDKFLHANLGPDSEINISPQEGKYIFVRIKQDFCSKGAEDNCNSDKLPRGNYSLKFNFTCDFCSSEERIINFTIPLCINHENEDLCK